MAWTEQEEAEWQQLDAIPLLKRSKAEDLRHTTLSVIRESAAKLQALEDERALMKEKRAREKRGPLYKVAIGALLAGLGSCGIGAATKGGLGMIGLGVLLVLASGLLNALNQKMTRTG